MPLAYSLIRFSSDKQKKGDSHRRQLEWSAAWCERNGHTLDTSLKADKAVSAFRGKNRRKGGLASFLEMVRIGRVAKGTVLLIENLDRLSREEMDDAYDQFRGILKAGVDIVTIEPERRYTKASLGDIIGIIEPLIIMSRAHEESVIKSVRCLAAWKERRQHASYEKPMNSVGPAWLRMVDGRWEPIPERVEVVKRIFRLCIDGNGLHLIAAELNRAEVPPIGGRSREGKWAVSSIGKILRSRSVLGELQPHVVRGKREKVGEPIPGYYPAVVDEKDFHDAQKALSARKNQKGPRGHHVRNLFTNLLRCAADGCTMVTLPFADKCNQVRLISSGAQRGLAGSTYTTFPYHVVEEAFLTLVKELKPKDILPEHKNGHQEKVAALTGRLQELDHQIGRVKADLKAGGDFDAGLQFLRELEGEKVDTAAALEKAKAEAVANDAETLGEAQSLIGLLDSATDDERPVLRTKIKARIAALVSEMWMLVVPLAARKRKSATGHARVAALSIWFKEGMRRRDLVLYYRPGNAHAKARGEALSDLINLDHIDLRDRAQARALAAELAKMELRPADG
jgi:DNA invertase Pin-like site-specific DNA recombinase